MTQRVFLYPKDLALLLGKSVATAHREFKTLKTIFGKAKEDKITIDEYCRFYNLDKADIQQRLK